MTAIFAGDETSTGDEGREGGASSAEGERTAEDAVAVANPPRRSLLSIAAKSAAAAKAQGEKAAAENAAAAAEKAAAAASRAAERRRQADLHTAKSVAAAEAAAAAVMAAAANLAAASAAAPAAVSAAAVSAAACSGHGGGQREDCTSGWPFHQATRAGPVGRSPSYTCLNPKLSKSQRFRISGCARGMSAVKPQGGDEPREAKRRTSDSNLYPPSSTGISELSDLASRQARATAAEAARLKRR